MAQVWGLAATSSGSRLPQASAFPSDSHCCSCWGSAFSAASIHFVQLKSCSHSYPGCSTQIPTAQATGAATQISPLQFRPVSRHPWLPDPTQCPIASLLGALPVKKGLSTEAMAGSVSQQPCNDSLTSAYQENGPIPPASVAQATLSPNHHSVLT